MKEWYINGINHRYDGPAIENDIMKIWMSNGKIHRDPKIINNKFCNFPAIIISKKPSNNNWSYEFLHEMKPTVTEYWYRGKCHNPVGPAIIWKDGTEEYWEDG